MKILWTLTIVFMASFVSAITPTNTSESTDLSGLPAFNTATIEARLIKMNCLVKPVYETEVEAYLRAYLTYGYRDAEIMIGRTALYFPIIEHYLQINDLPEELKFLPVIESSLRPYAVSTAGAAGLWQFMPPTARELGLSVGSSVDERRDPYKATKAALTYLKSLYDQFGSWELALAAYNAGAGSVRKAIRLANSKDYWVLRKFLPRETQKYIPRFIAASYVVQNFYLHGLSPAWPDFDRQWTRTTKVYNAVSFSNIVEKTGISWKILKELNPAYRKNYIPASIDGNYLILPEMNMLAFQDWKQKTVKLTSAPPNWKENYYKTNYTVLTGDTIEKLARIYRCSIWDIMQWNALKTQELYYRQELILYHPKKKVGELDRA